MPAFVETMVSLDQWKQIENIMEIGPNCIFTHKYRLAKKYLYNMSHIKKKEDQI